MDKRRSLGIIAVAAVALLLVSAVVAVDADAARGANRGKGGKNGGGGTTPSTAVLTVAPNPVPLNSTSITISGSGFAANQLLYLDVSGWLPSPSVTTQPDGSFSMIYSHDFWGAGQYFVKAYVGDTVVAMVNFTVCSTNPC